MYDVGWSLRRAESISICNAEKTTDIFIISGMTKLRITNAYIHDCRIANSAGRRILISVNRNINHVSRMAGVAHSYEGGKDF
jgi:hypothetical protein